MAGPQVGRDRSSAASVRADLAAVSAQAHGIIACDFYGAHYNDHRPHQSRSQRPPAVETTAMQPISDLADVCSIRRQPVLKGLINQYHRAA
jgi:hypothetical protein